MDVMSAESPVKAAMRQVNFWPDPEVRAWLDTYVPAQGMTIRGYVLRLIREDMQRVEQGEPPKANGRRDTAQRKRGSASAESGSGSINNQRELVPIEEMHVA